ncbi:MAG: hypothetical protein WC455_08375 [Dehalococcoidia bacterium]|jgi:hypothetical protein
MSGITGVKMLYFICAWVVAGLALLAAILLGVAWESTYGFGAALECIFIGATACIALLYLSGFFTHQIALLISGIAVGCVALLSMVLKLAGSFSHGYHLDGTLIAGNVFFGLFLGLFCTILLIHLSGKFGRD